MQGSMLSLHLHLSKNLYQNYVPIMEKYVIVNAVSVTEIERFESAT